MDILDQYNKEKPTVSPVPRERAATPNESEMRLDEHTYRSRAILGELRAPKMVSWVFRHSGGALKTERQAGYLLLFISGVIVLASMYIVVITLRGRVKVGKTGVELERQRQEYMRAQSP